MKDNLARDNRGVPADLANNAWTLRAQGRFLMFNARRIKLAVMLGLGLTACEGEEQPIGIEEPLRCVARRLQAGQVAWRQGRRRSGHGGAPVCPSRCRTVPSKVPRISPFGGGQRGHRRGRLSFRRRRVRLLAGQRGSRGSVHARAVSLGGHHRHRIEARPGLHDLIAVGFDKKGKAGRQSKQAICVQSDVVDKWQCLQPGALPPAAVAVLRWNFDADVDLSVLSPQNVRYDYQERAADRRQEDRDRAEGRREPGLREHGQAEPESFIWHDQPATGTWYLYANLFDICGQAAVSYELPLYRRKDHGDGTFSLDEEKTFGGEFVRSQIQTDNNKCRSTSPPSSFPEPPRSRAVLLASQLLPKRAGRSRASPEGDAMIVQSLLKIAMLGATWVLYLLLFLSVVSIGAMLEALPVLPQEQERR